MPPAIASTTSASCDKKVDRRLRNVSRSLVRRVDPHEFLRQWCRQPHATHCAGGLRQPLEVPSLTRACPESRDIGVYDEGASVAPIRHRIQSTRSIGALSKPVRACRIARSQKWLRQCQNSTRGRTPTALPQWQQEVRRVPLFRVVGGDPDKPAKQAQATQAPQDHAAPTTAPRKTACRGRISVVRATSNDNAVAREPWRALLQVWKDPRRCRHRPVSRALLEPPAGGAQNRGLALQLL